VTAVPAITAIEGFSIWTNSGDGGRATRSVRMENRLFVGNLPSSASEGELETAFADHGTVVSVVVIRDRETGRSRGFGFVEMETEEMAEAAAGALDGFEMDGRRLRVNEAQPKDNQQRRSEYGERW
jgi:RNA recognition motif-containing protein